MDVIRIALNGQCYDLRETKWCVTMDSESLVKHDNSRLLCIRLENAFHTVHPFPNRLAMVRNIFWLLHIVVWLPAVSSEESLESSWVLHLQTCPALAVYCHRALDNLGVSEAAQMTDETFLVLAKRLTIFVWHPSFGIYCRATENSRH